MEARQLLEDFEKHLSNPEDYLNPSAELKAHCLAGVKNVFDYLQNFCRRQNQSEARGDTKAKKLSSGAAVPTGPLPELYVDGFDVEQIWEQIQLVNEPLIAHLTKQVDKLSRMDMKKRAGERKKKVVVPDTNSGGMDDPESDSEGDDEYFSEEDGSNLEDLDEGDEVRKSKKIIGERKTVVDDRFFKLAEMEKFLEKVEREQDKEKGGADVNLGQESDDSDSLDDDDIDYFANVPSDIEEGGSRGTKRAHYEDFFDAPEWGEEEKQTSKKSRRQDDKVKSNEKEDEIEEEEEGEEEGSLYDDEEGEFSDGDISGEEEKEKEERRIEAEREVREELMEERSRAKTLDEETEKNQILSSHERQQLKMHDRITALEEANLDEKPWQMAGEATAKSRPENSLLQEDLRFDHMTRPAPVITDETTKTLEDIIRQRIIDEAWDDVERRVKPKEKPYDYSRSRPLDQEKSKLSLAEVYEQEYIKQTQTLEEIKEDERHTVIKEMMKKLFVKLDALSNFQFTPKPPKPEVKIVANVPAIQMEEVAPVATSDAALLAPEEIQMKSKVPEVGSTEKTETNRKRERRLKKRQKRFRVAERNKRAKLVAKLKPGLGNKYTKKSLTKKLKEREEEEKVDKSLKSSSQFFARLQEQVREQVKDVKAEERRSRRRTSKSQQYKL